jgi:sulfatase maturation enzyme AslB (radical SAM superfamily)
VEYIDRLPIEGDLRPRYRLTTNGSLLNENIIEFLEEHDFSLILSFDGLAQDISRKKGSFDFLASLVPRILAKPRISLETNSVFSPETIGYLSESVRYIIELEVPKIDVNLADAPAWTSLSLLQLEEEIARVGAYFESRYRRPQDVPWAGFYERPRKAVFCCSAGMNQMALSAQGTLWGCHLFPHYSTEKKRTEGYNKYCFGDVDSFLKNPRRIYAQKIRNYSDLCMDRFSTPRQVCLMCREIEECWICPLAAALTTGEVGKIPAWRCKAGRLLRKKKRLLLERFEKRIRGAGNREIKGSA